MGYKLVAFPLLFMVFISILAAFGLGSDSRWYGTDGQPLSFNQRENVTDSTGFPIAYTNGDHNYVITTGDPNWTVTIRHWGLGGTYIDENKTYVPFIDDGGYTGFYVNYYNGTNAPSLDSLGTESNIGGDKWKCELSHSSDGFHWMGLFFVAGQSQVLGILLALGMFAFILGLNVVGSGTRDASVQFILVTVVFGGLWTFLSAVGATNLLMQIPMGLGYIFYFVLTIIYTLGVMTFAVHGGD